VCVVLCWLQADGTLCLVLEHCGRGTLDMLLHHSRSPLARPAPAPAALTAPPGAAAAATTDSSSGSGSAGAAGHHSKGEAQRDAGAGSQQTEPLPLPRTQNQPEVLTRPDLVKLLPLLRGIVRGLLHLHTRRPAILHRDIKPANIFIGHGMQVHGLEAGGGGGGGQHGEPWVTLWQGA